MEYIKSFHEYTSGCYDNVNMPLFEESNLEQENVVYKAYYPQENQEDNIYIRDNKNCYGIFLMKDTNMQNLKSFAVV